MFELTPAETARVRRIAKRVGITAAVLTVLVILRRQRRIEAKIDNLAAIEGEMLELMGLVIKS